MCKTSKSMRGSTDGKRRRGGSLRQHKTKKGLLPRAATITEASECAEGELASSSKVRIHDHLLRREQACRVAEALPF